MPELPFGRGYRVGPDAVVAQNESWASRARDVPARDEWFISSIPVFGSGAAGQASYSANLRLTVLPRLAGVLEAKYARMRVTTASAGSFLNSSIYRYDTKNGKKTFVKVPSSDAEFSGASTGEQTYKLQNTVVLHPGENYFLGAYVSNSAIGVTSDNNTAVRLVPVRLATATLAGISSSLPGSVALELTSAEFAGYYVPWVMYLSAMANEVT
tara:strand:+ start:368 stop:1003 length:636 start_codon:yes stop_codon:yes gene_type:complete